MVLARPPVANAVTPKVLAERGVGGEGRAVSQSAIVTTPSLDGQTQILSVRGELDLATADGLYRRGRTAISRHTRLLLLDLADLSFCDACGLSAFVRIANEAQAAGCRYGLVAPQPLVVKMLRITDLNARLPVFATMEEACHHLMPLTGTAGDRLARQTSEYRVAVIKRVAETSRRAGHSADRGSGHNRMAAAVEGR
jgi:anti-sigma B factor antagonist